MSLPPVKVNLKENAYRIFFNDDWRAILQPFHRHRTVIITDRNVAKHHLNRWKGIIPGAECLILPPGEESKSLSQAEKIYSFLIEKNFSRDSLVVALGGGVIGDLAGFIAATFMRGVDFIQVPTTLLAMVDAAIGGKVGVNHRLGKNLIGAFYQPQAVLTDFIHLKTLPLREWLCGLGEVIKYGLIKDGEIFRHAAEAMQSGIAPEKWVSPEDIRRCAEIKAEIVSVDERESSGERMVLNFGHTIGHALEAAAGYNLFRHGEAVVGGMAGAAFISREKGLLSDADFKNLISALKKFPLPKMKADINSDGLMDFILHDKKVRGGKIRFVLIAGIGKTVIEDYIEDNLLKRAIDFTLDFI